jgi:hypothetical protein
VTASNPQEAGAAHLQEAVHVADDGDGASFARLLDDNS